MTDRAGDDGGLLRAIKGLVFEEEPGDNERPTDSTRGGQTSPAPVAVSVVKAPAAATLQSVDAEDRKRMIDAISKRVFAPGTPYEEYQAHYVNLDGVGLAEPDRKKAAWTLVVKKYGLDKVIESMKSCQNLLEQERGSFETSLNPEQGNGVIARADKEVKEVLRDIEQKRTEIERLNQEIAALDAKKTGLERYRYLFSWYLGVFFRKIVLTESRIP